MTLNFLECYRVKRKTKENRKLKDKKLDKNPMELSLRTYGTVPTNVQNRLGELVMAIWILAGTYGTAHKNLENRVGELVMVVVILAETYGTVPTNLENRLGEIVIGKSVETITKAYWNQVSYFQESKEIWGDLQLLRILWKPQVRTGVKTLRGVK